MNIFLTNPNPVICAQELDDKRVNKMTVETAQLLSTAHRLEGGSSSVYRTTHKNHPCAVWARASHLNYLWLYEHFISLCDEYTHRTGKVHLSDQKLREILQDVPNNIEALARTPFVNCSLRKDLPIHEAYRDTMRTKWLTDKRKPTWTMRDEPVWKSH